METNQSEFVYLQEGLQQLTMLPTDATHVSDWV